MEEFFALVDAHADEYVARLGEAVGIPSVSSDPAHRSDCVRQAEWLAEWVRRLGGTAELCELGAQEGTSMQLPPILLAQFGNDSSKPTLLIYFHYDVQPARLDDGWNSPPFTMTEKDGKLWGRGTTDDKGPGLAWLWVVEAYQALGRELPVNIKLISEGMEESGSLGLEEFVLGPRGREFMNGTDYVCISDNYWLSKSKPCLTYGLRGLTYFFVEIVGPRKDLHSGLFGGTVHEPMTDLVHIFSSLVDSRGNIQIEGISDLVRPVTDEERALYEPIDFSLSEFSSDAGGAHVIHKEDKIRTLMQRWRYPSLSIHGVEGAFYGVGGKTVIPGRVVGKFSIRLVPDMTPDQAIEVTRRHVERVFASLGSPNEMRLWCEHPGKPWLANPDHPNYVAGRKATELVWGVTPDFTREGGSIPITLTFTEATGKTVLMLPLGRSDDGAHGQNEKFDRENYIQGIKVLAAYCEELTKLPRE